jgi:hypothetical protein
MSEFSESYHLEADDQQAGPRLLSRANLDGVVFPPQRGWVSIVPRSEFGGPPERLLDANEGCLLRYLLDQDAGWMFTVYTGPILACSYECRWLDWSDPEHRIKVDASGVDVELVWRLAQRHGRDPRLLELQRILHPRIVRRTSQETGEHYDDFVDWPAGETLDNVAYAFARLLGLPHYEWLRWRDDLSDEELRAVRVSSQRPPVPPSMTASPDPVQQVRLEY